MHKIHFKIFFVVVDVYCLLFPHIPHILSSVCLSDLPVWLLCGLLLGVPCGLTV